MAYPNDCVCTQGIEQFIDPRLSMPQCEPLDRDSLELPIWDQKLLDAAENAAKLEAEAEAAKNVVIDPERIIKFVAQRTNLINQGYTKLTAYQIKSFYVQVDSLDKNWRDANVTLLFSHSCGIKAVPVPVVELGKPVLIPSSVLVPGKLRVMATATSKVNDYSVISTNSIEFQIYDPMIKPVAWPKLKDYDLYYMYQTLARQLIDEVKSIRDNTPVRIVGKIPCYITCVTNLDKGLKPIEIEFSALYDKYLVTYNIKDFVIDGMEPKERYVINFTLPNSVLGIDNISKEEYDEKRQCLERVLFMDSICYKDLCSLCDSHGISDVLPVESIKLGLASLPDIKISIPESVEITTLKVSIKDLVFDRTVTEE